MISRLLLGGVLTAAMTLAAPVNNIIAFGDSLSDTGNDYIATGGAVPAAPAYTGGEFSNGPNWIDQFATRAGLPAVKPILAGGTNFAFGGAETLKDVPVGPVSIPSVNTQVALLLAATNGHVPSDSLYTFWSGSNDIFNNGASATLPVQTADDIASRILAVAAAGGKTFMWLNLPPLGFTPKVGALGQPYIDGANAETAIFDAEWALDIAKLRAQGVDVIGVDVNSLFTRIITDFASGCKVSSADPYCFANISSPALGQNVDASTYLFWDNQHPTTAADSLIAAAAADALAPEPVTIGLAAGGLIVIGFARRRKLGGK